MFVHQEPTPKGAFTFCAILAMEDAFVALVDDALMTSEAGRRAERSSTDTTRELPVLQLDVTQVVVVVGEGALTLRTRPLCLDA